MDFKVADPEGITALQMDIKITGVSREIARRSRRRRTHASRSWAAGDRGGRVRRRAPRISTIRSTPSTSAW
jgi:polyribonucleotide nucleotidyltransferase